MENVLALYDNGKNGGLDVLELIEKETGYRARLLHNDKGEKGKYRKELVFLINGEYYRMSKREVFNLEQWVELKKLEGYQIDKIKFSY